MILFRPHVLLRLEALVALVAECFVYQRVSPGHWGMFALLFLVPDISLLGYLRSAGPASAAFYNLAHTYVFPLALCLLASNQSMPLLGQLALIWLAHISFDRILGFGLKYPNVFQPTHLQSSAIAAG